ncbi:hypothetical protein [Sphingomonas sp. LaA6.9]|uniref:hypothetical protein n=1 Tax=Sphingomonas sp. LaA6.9 TaxID=2919914 RepID=UPI001F4F1D4A|nr:hypothetical protein [Sphingomonas sp. LaA6.9]MCJ8158973.1 hypothetical protein [Sphingomonas sp. LaA6.9]
MAQTTILAAMAIFPRPVSPRRALRDLRGFLAMRQKHELIFGFLSITITTLLMAGFYVDSRVEKPWKRDIQYVESWPLDRSLEQIRAQQKIDAEKKKVLQAELEKRKQERMEQFRKVDRQLDALGL